VRVYFLRHGLAGDRSDWQGDDFDRPLTHDGMKRMERESKTIAELDLELDVIVTSPLVRAKQTAEIVAKRLGLRDVLVDDPAVGHGFSVANLRAILDKHRAAEAMMLVGHEPSMSQVIGDLLGGAAVDMKKGAIACLEIEPSTMRGELIWLLPPKVLTLKT
jgi:phosphohistidine phosphatase